MISDSAWGCRLQTGFVHELSRIFRNRRFSHSLSNPWERHPSFLVSPNEHIYYNYIITLYIARSEKARCFWGGKSGAGSCGTPPDRPKPTVRFPAAFTASLPELVKMPLFGSGWLQYFYIEKTNLLFTFTWPYVTMYVVKIKDCNDIFRKNRFCLRKYRHNLSFSTISCI